MAKNPQVGQTTTVPPDESSLPTTGEPEMTKATVETPLIKKTLPELISGFVQRVMEDPRQANQCGHDLAMWHDAQPLENRQKLIQETRAGIERAKQTTEYLFQQYVQIAQKDIP